ncbi:MAG TPA: hypothetical protein VER04_20955 [Polyangiaceae bacterium]|nr:hypothetical protein [Polyangiaceae bacterium]
MSRARNRRLPLVRALALLGIVGLWAVACGGPQPLAGSGAVCFRADECQAGLACIPETPGAAKHVCSDNLTGIISMVDGAAPDGDLPEAMGGSSGAAAAGAPASAGASPSAGAAGKPATGGAPGAAGAGTSAGAPAGGSASAGAPAGGASTAGAPAGGAAAAGAPAGGSSSAGGGAANGGASAGSGG